MQGCIRGGYQIRSIHETHSRSVSPGGNRTGASSARGVSQERKKRKNERRTAAERCANIAQTAAVRLFPEFMREGKGAGAETEKNPPDSVFRADRSGVDVDRFDGVIIDDDSVFRIRCFQNDIIDADSDQKPFVGFRQVVADQSMNCDIIADLCTEISV